MTNPILVLIAFCSLASSQTPTDGAAPDLDSVARLAKTYFRDSAELPMDVAVKTVVKDRSGKVKRQTQATARMVFHGYSQSGRFSLESHSSWRQTKSLHDSLSGDLAAFAAGTLLAAKKDTSRFEMQRPAQPDQPFVVRLDDRDCPELKLIEGAIFPQRGSFCGSARFLLSADGAGGLIFRHFSFDNAGLPARAKIAYLGDVEILTFHVDEDFQSWLLPGDPKPFLVPKQVTTTVTTDKGEIVFTNQYTPHWR